MAVEGGASGQPLPKSQAVLFEVGGRLAVGAGGGGGVVWGFKSLAQLLKMGQADLGVV